MYIDNHYTKSIVYDMVHSYMFNSLHLDKYITYVSTIFIAFGVILLSKNYLLSVFLLSIPSSAPTPGRHKSFYCFLSFFLSVSYHWNNTAGSLLKLASLT